MTGSAGQRRVPTTFLRNLPLVVPPLPEQKKIATILTSVDTVIEKTQAQIEKLNDLKTGMMQELLTKGIGPDGKPHKEFKDSPVGRIPAGWDSCTLGSISKFVTSGSRGWSKYYSDKGAMFIRIGNLTRSHINFRFEDTVFVTPPTGGEGTRTKLSVGDICISITADLGIIGVVNDSIGDAYVNQHVSLVRPKETAYSRWLGYFLSFEDTQAQFNQGNDAGAKAGLNLSSINNIRVALPSKKEATAIVSILDRIVCQIDSETQKIFGLINLKKALMQDLLTGKVRVTPDPDS